MAHTRSRLSRAPFQSFATTMVVVGLVIACATVALAQQAAPALIAEAVADTQTHKLDYAFDVTTQSASLTWRAHFDPTRTGAKLRLVEPARLSSDQQRSFDSAAAKMRDASWCASEEIGHAQDFRLLREDADNSVYSFRPSPRSGDESARRMASNMHGELTVSRTNPDISNIHIVSMGAFSPFPLVNIESIDITMRCAQAPNGRRYAAETVSDFRGRAFGRVFADRSVQRISNLTR